MPSKGLKINNTNSTVPPPKQSASDIFNDKANESFKKIEDYKTRTWELSAKFKSMIEDRVLPENKSPIAKDIENEVMTKLISLASEINEDETQPEGMGSTALSFLLMKMMLIQRDTLNTILYKLEKIEKQIKTNDNK